MIFRAFPISVVDFAAILAALFFVPASVAGGEAVTPSYVAVTRVLNGNTLLLQDGTAVKLLGVASPEKKSTDDDDRIAERLGIGREVYRGFARRSKDWLTILLKGERVHLEYEPSSDGPVRDLEGRLVA